MASISNPCLFRALLSRPVDQRDRSHSRASRPLPMVKAKTGLTAYAILRGIVAFCLKATGRVREFDVDLVNDR